VKSLLDVEEAEAVRGAVAAAERSSGAEIVPVVVAASDGHEAALWKGAALGALVGAGAAAVALWLRSPWVPEPWVPIAPVTAGLLLGLAAALPAPTRRWLAGRRVLDERVERAAAEAFLDHEVFATRERTGLLIYVSLLERRVSILADSGIHPSVPPEEWAAMARTVAREMRSKAPAEALLSAVTQVGGLLAARGPERRPDDVNELPDAPVEGAPS